MKCVKQIEKMEIGKADTFRQASYKLGGYFISADER